MDQPIIPIEMEIEVEIETETSNENETDQWESFRSHEAEDLSDLPEVFFLSSEELRSSHFNVVSEQLPPHTFRARDESRRQGRLPVQIQERRDLLLLSLEQRVKSFKENIDEGSAESAIRRLSEYLFPTLETVSEDERTAPWDGPCTKQMALAGWCRLSKNKAQCCFCKVTARDWAPGDNAWVRHKHFSPNCSRLRQVGDAGIRPSPRGKRLLRHSMSSMHELVCPA